MSKDVICWWSGGVVSAVACRCAIDLFGKDRCRIIMIDTANEDDDTYRFKQDCEVWYNLPIETITAIGRDYGNIQDVWTKHVSLNVANGAICSNKLKRKERERWEKTNTYTHQIFGYEFTPKEFKRALSMTLNHQKAKAIYPLLMFGYDKKKCCEMLESAGIQIPRSYQMGFHNNNCLNTGCVQGGVGYWQKMQRDFPDKFDAMADIEHKLTNIKGTPVTMLKSQSKADKELIKNGWEHLVFLKKHKDYPKMKCLDDMPDCKIEPLFECNGFCGINDLGERNETEEQINFEK